MENKNVADINDARVKNTAETVEYIAELLAIIFCNRSSYIAFYLQRFLSYPIC